MNDKFAGLNLENILVKVEDGLALITMNRPKAMNALNSQTLNELKAIFALIAKEDDILGAIITGEGRAFVAGADISEMQNYGSEESREYIALAQGVFNDIEDLEKPVIAAVNGFALGGGCELSMSCDIRIASDAASFAQPEVGLGLIACFGGTQRLPRLVGVGKAKELLYTSRRIDAKEAYEIGLVNKVVPADDLLKEARAMMDMITAQAPKSIKYTKVAINKGVNMDLKTALELEKDVAALVFATEDKEEGIAAFLEKRPASFKNK